jgi:hypothetical protein
MATPIVHCACCVASFPPDEGQLGDICPVCGWECDILEGDDLDWSSANKDYLSIFRTAWFHSVDVKAQRAFCSRMMIVKRNERWAKLDAGMPSSGL